MSVLLAGILKELALCELIATEAHKGQLRRGGEPYIEHPIRVAMMMGNDTMKCVAVLHDVLEDTNETADSLLGKGVSVPIVHAVMCLTKKDGQRYDEYIKNIKKFGDGLVKVKIADMFDNLCGDPTQRQKQKYHKAMNLLSS